MLHVYNKLVVLLQDPSENKAPQSICHSGDKPPAYANSLQGIEGLQPAKSARANLSRRYATD